MNATERARELLRSAADAESQLREAVHELVQMRAWTVLGYSDFSQMWKAENGYACPTHVQVLAVEVLMAEGLNTFRSRKTQNGHRRAEVAAFVGLPIEKKYKRDGWHSPTVSSIVIQLAHGVPPAEVRKYQKGYQIASVIETHGTRPYIRPRRRQQSRRLGKAADEVVSEGFLILRREADEVAEIAREADVSKAEIYRQAVAEYLARIRATRREAS